MHEFVPLSFRFKYHRKASKSKGRRIKGKEKWKGRIKIGRARIKDEEALAGRGGRKEEMKESVREGKGGGLCATGSFSTFHCIYHPARAEGPGI